MGWHQHLYKINRSENSIDHTNWENLVKKADQIAFFNNINLYFSESSISLLIDRNDIDDELASFATGDYVRRYENCGNNEDDWPLHFEESDFLHLEINGQYLIDPDKNYKYNGYHPKSVKYLTDKVIDAILNNKIVPEKERTVASLLQLSTFYEFALTENLIVDQDAL